MFITKFLKNENGNISILFAGSIIAICGIVGISIDYARVMNEKSKMQNVLDASLLAAATEFQRTGNEDQAKLVGRTHMTASLPEIDAEKLEITIDGGAMTGSYAGVMDNTFLSVLAKPTTAWSIETNIGLGSRSNTDFALAIDVSNTMVLNDLLDGLHDSLEEFSEQAFENTNPGEVSVSVVPFANAVSFDTSYDRWLDPDNGYSQTATFNGCFEYQPVTSADLLNTAGNSNQIAAFDRRRQPAGENVPFCPEEDSNAVFYIDNEADLTTAVSSLTTGQGTNTANGLTWAWRALSPLWRAQFNESATYPRADAPENNKVLILLTDGRPFRLPSVNVGTDRDEARDDALAEFREVCDQIIAAGNIDLYSIVYGNIMNEDQRTAIRDCTAGEGRSYWGGNADQLSSIFTNIVKMNNELALTR